MALAPADLPPPSPLVLDRNYPGLRRIHEGPDIYVIDDFLPPSACEALIACATPHLKASGWRARAGV